MHLILLWALVALIGHVHCKCSLAPIVDDGRSVAYACIHGDLNDLAEINDEVEWIEFSVSRFQYIPENAFLRFTNLRRLSFYNCHVNVISPDAFAGLQRLEWLIFHGTRIHVARSAWFRHLPNLRRLILDRCGLVHVEPEVFSAVPKIEILGLRDNDLDCLPIEELSYLRALKAVRIDGNPWLCECRQRLDSFFRDRSILQEECARDVDVYKKFQCMSYIGIPVLPATLTSRHSTAHDRGLANITGNEFETTVLTSLDRLPDKTTWIEISGLRIDAIPRYTFFRFGNSLRSLELSNCQIGTIESGAFAGLHKLQRLSLTGNQFSTVGAGWFRDLVGLQQLVLRGNGLEHIERTAFWHLGSDLRYLDIRDNRFRCIAIEELAQLRKLERIDTIGNPWTCACRRSLQSFLTDRNVGFEISAGRCTDEEIPESPGGGRLQQSNVDASTGTGRVHWRTFGETIRKLNTTVRRPSPAPPTIEIHVATQSPPIYHGSCHPDKGDSSRRIYTCTGITSIEELSVIPATTHTVRVLLSNIKTIPSNAFVRFNGYLSRLEFRDCGIEKIKYRAFAGLYNLEYLSLHSNQLDSITSETVEGLSNLRHLDVSRNHIYRLTNDVFDALPYLTGLDVSENRMNCIGVEHMDHRLPYLVTLDVTANPWSCLCGTKLAEFLDKRAITYDAASLLDTNECYVTQDTTKIVTATPTPLTPTMATTTESMTIEGSCTSYDEPEGTRYRCMGGNYLLLQTIPDDVTAIEFSEGHLPQLPKGAFARFSDLRELIIRNCGVRSLERGTFDGLEDLRNLTIQDNPLESVGSAWFALGSLERLDLRGNSIKYVAPSAFRHLDRLSYLNLEGNDLKCIFTSDLEEMPNVHAIEFAGNPLKWRCRVELEQFLEMRQVKFVRVENSCEGKKLVRNLLFVNRTDGSFDCPSECSTAGDMDRPLLMFIAALSLAVLGFH